MVSTYSLLLLTLERYAEVAHPIYHKVRLTCPTYHKVRLPTYLPQGEAPHPIYYKVRLTCPTNHTVRLPTYSYHKVSLPTPSTIK